MNCKIYGALIIHCTFSRYAAYSEGMPANTVVCNIAHSGPRVDHMRDVATFLDTSAIALDGQSVRLGDLVTKKPVAFVFLRHYG